MVHQALSCPEASPCRKRRSILEADHEPIRVPSRILDTPKICPIWGLKNQTQEFCVQLLHCSTITKRPQNSKKGTRRGPNFWAKKGPEGDLDNVVSLTCHTTENADFLLSATSQESQHNIVTELKLHHILVHQLVLWSQGLLTAASSECSEWPQKP